MFHAYRASRWDVIRRILAGVLIAAAILKAREVVRVAIVSRTGHEITIQRSIELAAIEFEIILGVWLLLGAAGRRTCLITAGAWTLFLAVALRKAIGGETSCGCFGAVPVNPWITAAFDAIALIALLRSAPPALPDALPNALPDAAHVGQTPQAATLFPRAVIVGACSVIFAAWLIGGLARTEHQRVQLGQSREELMPERWMGRALPISDHVDIADQLMHGEWVVLFHRTSCEHCRRAIAHYEFFFGDPLVPTVRLALVEVPPFGNVERATLRNILTGKLDRSRDWMMLTPLALRMKDGVVLAVESGESAGEPLRVIPEAMTCSADIIGMSIHENDRKY